jgi:predicted membrane protein
MKLLQQAFDPSIASEFGDQIKSYDFLGVPLFDGPSLWNLLIRFAFNLLVCWVIVNCLYFRKSHRRDYYFTFMLFSVTIFLLLFLLQNLSLEIGFALGLFAIFGMIRYRTETLPVREMTYLFVIIGISIINGFSMTTSYAALLATNILIVAACWVLESLGPNTKNHATKIILYEKIELIKPEKHNELMADLKARTGLNIVNVQIGSINFLKDTAYLKVTYIPEDDEYNDIDMTTKFKNK